MDYVSRYNKNYFLDIIDPLLKNILKRESKFKNQFMSEFKNQINKVDEEYPAEMILFDCILRCSKLSENFFDYNKCGEIDFDENASINEDDEYLSIPEFFQMGIEIAKKIKIMKESGKSRLYNLSKDFLDYRFFVLLQRILFHISSKKGILENDKDIINELIEFLEEMKNIIKKESK